MNFGISLPRFCTLSFTPPQGASVQAAALGAALGVLQARLGVSGVVRKIIDTSAAQTH